MVSYYDNKIVLPVCGIILSQISLYSVQKLLAGPDYSKSGLLILMFIINGIMSYIGLAFIFRNIQLLTNLCSQITSRKNLISFEEKFSTIRYLVVQLLSCWSIILR